MLNDALEFLAKKMGNVVKYDTAGNPSIFVPFKKCLSSELDASLPAHVHPAFIINDVAQDVIYIGKYKACALVSGGSLYSLPGRDPANTIDYDTFLTRMRAAHTGASGLTIADHGLILLTAYKNGWSPKGNNNYGTDVNDGTLWAENVAVTVGQHKVARGWEYEAKIAHTTSNDHYPENDRVYWKKLKQVGGTMSGASGVGDRTLTGSGPASWYLGEDTANIADAQGDVTEQVYGYRTVDGEIQIMKNNDAADPAADMSVNSAAWKAILPSQSDDTYTLVAPGTAGTLKWKWANSKITLDTETTVEDQNRNTAFKDLAVNSTNVPYIPSIMRELGLFPVSGDSLTKGMVYVNTKGERVARRGGNYNSASNAGVGCMNGLYTRSSASGSHGARPRSL